MSDKCNCNHTQHDCTLADNCKVAAMCKRVVEGETLSKSVLKRHAVQNGLEVQNDTITIDRAEYGAMKADAERYRWLKEQNADLENNTFTVLAHDCTAEEQSQKQRGNSA